MGSASVCSSGSRMRTSTPLRALRATASRSDAVGHEVGRRDVERLPRGQEGLHEVEPQRVVVARGRAAPRRRGGCAPGAPLPVERRVERVAHQDLAGGVRPGRREGRLDGGGERARSRAPSSRASAPRSRRSPATCPRSPCRRCRRPCRRSRSRGGGCACGSASACRSAACGRTRPCRPRAQRVEVLLGRLHRAEAVEQHAHLDAGARDARAARPARGRWPVPAPR